MVKELSHYSFVKFEETKTVDKMKSKFKTTLIVIATGALLSMPSNADIYLLINGNYGTFELISPIVTTPDDPDSYVFQQGDKRHTFSGIASDTSSSDPGDNTTFAYPGISGFAIDNDSGEYSSISAMPDYKVTERITDNILVGNTIGTERVTNGPLSIDWTISRVTAPGEDGRTMTVSFSVYMASDFDDPILFNNISIMGSGVAFQHSANTVSQTVSLGSHTWTSVDP